MRKAKFLLTLAPWSLALMAISSSANPLASGLTPDSATLPALNEGLVQKVQSWPCRQSRKDMTAEVRRFCYGYYHRRYYYAYPVYEYGYSAYGYPAYGYPADGYPAYGYRYPVYEYPAYGYGYPVYVRP
jgi:hypothetical protein